MSPAPRDPYDTLASIFLGEPGRIDGDAAHLGNGGASGPLHSSSLSLSDVADAPQAARAGAARAGVDRSAARSAGSAGAGAARAADRTQLLRVTAALTGHLPVMAGLWATQFADRIGASDGPTGLIRCERELVHVEILRGGGRHIGLRQGEELHAWLRRAASIVHRWVICVPATEDPAVVLDAGFADAALLTSADEAAVAAARRVIDAIGRTAASMGLPCSLGVIVVGAPPERVRWMIDQLGAPAPAAVDLPLAGSIQRMDRVESSERYGFEAPAPPRIADLLRTLELAANEGVARLNGDGVDAARRPPARAFGSAASDPSSPSAVAPAAEPPPAAGPTAARRDEPQAGPAAAGTGGSTPQAVSAAASDSSEILPGCGWPSGLAPHIPGLEPLGLRCPVAPGVELAVDRGGRLHMVAPVDRLVELAGARRWAEVNWELLGRAFPVLGARRDGASFRGSIVERVVTLDAVHVEALHGAGMALDLLIPIQVSLAASPTAAAGGGVPQWIHRPLNALSRGLEPR